jgi:gas vesicle protein
MTEERERSDERDESESGESRRRWHSTSFLTGLVVGAAVGAGVALLLAPGSGEETRRTLRRRARTIRHEAAEGLVSARDEARRLLQEKKEAARRRLKEGVERLEEELGG